MGFFLLPQLYRGSVITQNIKEMKLQFTEKKFSPLKKPFYISSKTLKEVIQKMAKFEKRIHLMGEKKLTNERKSFYSELFKLKNTVDFSKKFYLLRLKEKTSYSALYQAFLNQNL